MWAEWPMTEVKLLSGCVCIDVCLCVGPDLGLEVSLICQYGWGRLMTYLAHPRLAFAHGFSPLHHLPQPSLPCQSKQMRECYFINVPGSKQVQLYEQWHMWHDVNYHIKKDTVFFSQANIVVTVIDLQCVWSKPMHLNKEFKWTL